MTVPKAIGFCWLGLWLTGACLLLVDGAVAQDTSRTPSSTAVDTSATPSEGKTVGDFQVTQSIEVGGRISDVTGSQAMYDTLANYQSGARILDQSLTMQSLTHLDVFDTLTLSSFGWGGDPEQAARLRIVKYDWYIFSGTYQHMQNYFNYDLFANPLNPPSGGTPFIPILNSPHAYDNRQNLYNFDLVLMPTKPVSFRLDYNRNRFIGPAFSSIHEGTDALTDEYTNNTLNGYRFGVDVHVNKKTMLSYTQQFQFYAGDTTYSLNPFNSWPLPNGTPVTFGLPWFNGGSPCSAPLTNGIANPSCNGFLDYSLFQQIHTTIPTEQINFVSSSVKWLDFNGQYQYSQASMSTPFAEDFTGLISRSNLLGSNTTGSYSDARSNSSSADVSAIIHLSRKLRLVESFRFRTFSVPGTFVNLGTNFYTAASLGSANLLSPIFSFPGASLLHGSSSPPDIVNEITSNLIGQNTKANDFQVQYDVTRTFGVRAGFNWSNNTIQPGSTYQAALGDIYFPNNANRGNCVGVPLNPDGSCTFVGVIAPFGNPTTEINRYSGVVGAWFRRGTAFHANMDAEFGGADNWIYRIDPLRFYNIKANVSYAPHPWLMLGGNLLFTHATNSDGGNAYNQHNYSATVTTSIMPNKKWGVDLAYNFDAIQQNMNLCFEGAVVPGAITCVGDNSLMEVLSIYQTHTQYGYFAFTTTPVERLTVRAGYSIVDNQGNTTQFNVLQPLGPLASTYQMPLAGVDIALYKNVTFVGGWDYYQYSEGSFVGPTASRYFHANNTTLALRYAF